jgi:hypothetical protein
MTACQRMQAGIPVKEVRQSIVQAWSPLLGVKRRNMNDQHPHHPSSPVTPTPPRTLEDKMLKFIEGHNVHIWLAIAAISAAVVYLR